MHSAVKHTVSIVPSRSQLPLNKRDAPNLHQAMLITTSMSFPLQIINHAFADTSCRVVYIPI